MTKNVDIWCFLMHWFEDIGILNCVIVVPGIVLSMRSCAEGKKHQEIVCHPEQEAPFFSLRVF